MSEVEKVTGKVQEINTLERMVNGEKIGKEDVEMKGGSMVGEWRYERGYMCFNRVRSK